MEPEIQVEDFMQLYFQVTYALTRWWQTRPDVDKLLKHWRFPEPGYMTLLAIKTQGRVSFTEDQSYI